MFFFIFALILEIVTIQKIFQLFSGTETLTTKKRMFLKLIIQFDHFFQITLNFSVP